MNMQDHSAPTAVSMSMLLHNNGVVPMRDDGAAFWRCFSSAHAKDHEFETMSIIGSTSSPLIETSVS